MIKFDIDTRDLDDKLERITAVDKMKIHEGIGIIIEKNVVFKIDQLGLVDTGTFKASITHTTGPDSVVIHDGVSYGIHLEYGTRPHKIRIQEKKALHWKDGGKDVFAMSVMHPGTKEYAPFRKGMVDSVEEVTKFVRMSIINAAK